MNEDNDDTIDTAPAGAYPDGMVSFSFSAGAADGPALADDSTYERWLLSAPDLEVDGGTPAHVVVWSNRFLAELQEKHKGVDLHDPSGWDIVPEIVRAFSHMIADERKRVKSGSYDTYALGLSRQRGTFVGGQRSADR